jgi:lactoylglutathione lyase
MTMTLTTMLNVSEMARSVPFYRDTLGLTLRMESPFWSEFDVSGSTLALHGGGNAAAGGGDAHETVAGVVNIGFNVDDLDATCTVLKSKGVRFVMEPQERPGEPIRLVIFLDPDGAQISLAQTVKR